MGARVALCGPGRAREVVRSLGPREDCRDGMRERWAKVARLEVGEGGAAGGWCPRDDDELSVGARARAGFILHRVLIVSCAMPAGLQRCVGGFWSSGLGFEPGRAGSAERSRRHARACVRACERAGSEQGVSK